MADISKIEIDPAGDEYNLKDATARAGIESSKTVTGNPITVTDAAAINAEDITVDITPIQDLHGYDRPWAGGGWKNKLPMTVDGIKAVNTSGTWSGNVYSHRGINVEMLVDSADNITGFKVSGTALDNMLFPLIRKAGLDTLPSGSYIMNGCPAGGAGDGSTYYMGFYAPGKSKYDMGKGGTSISLSGNEDVSTNIYIHIAGGYAIQGSLTFYPMIRLSTETDSTFAPYSNICPIEGRTGAELTQKDDATNPTVTHTYTVSFGGTVYGGKWHVTEGGTDNEMGYAEFDGSDDENWVMSTSQQYLGNAYISLVNCKNNASFLCNEAEPVPLSNFAFGKVCIASTTLNVWFFNTSTTLSDFRAYLAQHPLQICYELDTPTTISTPKQNVPMLQGINTLSASTGDVSLKYQPDNVVGELKGEIEDNIVYEDYKWTTESSQSYSAGTPGTYGTSFSQIVTKEGYDVIGVTFLENRRLGDCILTLHYTPSSGRVEVIVFRATSSSVTIYKDDITYRVAYKKA